MNKPNLWDFIPEKVNHQYQNKNYPQNTDKYIWTNHSVMKMRYYGLSENRIKRIIRFPARIEEGIAPNTVAAMQPADSKKKYQEIWTMYQIQKSNLKNQKSKIKVITAWRYPGKSPKRDPIPREIMQEIQNLL